jgi:hypothetical protein
LVSNGSGDLCGQVRDACLRGRHRALEQDQPQQHQQPPLVTLEKAVLA